MKSQFEFLRAHTVCKLLDVCRSEKWVQTKTVESCTGIGVLHDVWGLLLSKCRTVLRYTCVISCTPIRIVRRFLHRFSPNCHTISSLMCVSHIEFHPNRRVNVGSADRNSVMRRFLRNPQSLNSLSFLPWLHPLTTLRTNEQWPWGLQGCEVAYDLLLTIVSIESSWYVMTHGDVREGKWRGNWRMEWVASTLHTTSERGVSTITTADAHTSAASSRLNWRWFKRTRPFRRKTKSGFCACAITFQTQSISLFYAPVFCFLHLLLLWRQEGSCEMS